MAEFCVHERHGGVCEKTKTYCNLGACPYEQLEQFAPVVHGQWIESANFDTGFWVCSKCRFVSEAIAAHKLYGYCPNCGARMDGGAVDG